MHNFDDISFITRVEGRFSLWSHVSVLVSVYKDTGCVIDGGRGPSVTRVFGV